MGARQLRIVVLTLAACEAPFVPPPPAPPPVASLHLVPEVLVLQPGDTQRLTVTLRDAAGQPLADRPVTFTSTSTAVVAVSALGLARGVAAGTAAIVAAAEGQMDTTTVRVAQFTLFSISPGGNHTCGASSDGILCWGYNWHGQLGMGARGDAIPIPTPVRNLPAAAPAAGGNHTCALVGGRAHCWGWNQSGQLGSGMSGTLAEASPVQTDSSFLSLTAGGQHTCALTTGGNAFCWGLNADGQLGDGTLTNQVTPVPVHGGLIFVALAAGGRHTCGVAADSTAHCWGLNLFGQLGNGGQARQNHSTPAPVTGGYRFTAITAGRFHTCAIDAGGAAYCWGYNGLGALGNATPDSASSIPVPVGGGMDFVRVSAGGLHSCALTADGSAHCWGYNALGQLGDSSLTSRSSPAPVRTGERFVTLRTFGDHTCGMTPAGRAMCWGYGGTGELGTGTFANGLTPVPVAGQP